jgi:hypothetical protein
VRTFETSTRLGQISGRCAGSGMYSNTSEGEPGQGCSTGPGSPGKPAQGYFNASVTSTGPRLTKLENGAGPTFRFRAKSFPRSTIT